MEIERKFLVARFDLDALTGDEIIENVTQSYASLSPEVRIRTKGNQGYLTLKSDGTLSRKEIETEIPLEIAREMITEIPARIEKVRYTLERFEIDIYRGKLAGLITAEVELTSESEELPRVPECLTLGKEVTEDKRFKNKNLATQGLPK